MKRNRTEEEWFSEDTTVATIMEDDDDVTDPGEEVIKQQTKKNVKEENDAHIIELLTRAGYASPQKINSTGAFGTIFRVENSILKVLNYYNLMSSLRKVLIKEYYLGRSVKEEGVRYYGLMYHDVKKSIVDIKRIIILSPNFVAMEMKYYKFGDLRNLVSPKLTFPIPTHVSKKILKDVSKGLLKLKDNNIVHCDVKLENIFIEKINQDEGKIRVILGDFGVSAFGTDDENYLKGTMKYLSPEALNERDYSPKSDVYALGIVMKCLTQNDPYVNREFLDNMTHPIKSERYDIEDVRNNIENFIIIIKRTQFDNVIPNSENELNETSIELGNSRYSVSNYSDYWDGFEYLTITNLKNGTTTELALNEYRKIGNWSLQRDKDRFNASSFCSILFIGRNSKNIIILFNAHGNKAFAVFDLNFKVLQIVVYPVYFPKSILDMKVHEETLSIKTKTEWIEYPHVWWGSEMRLTVFSDEPENYNPDYNHNRYIRELESYLSDHVEPHKSCADELKLFSLSPLKIHQLEKETAYGLNIYSLENSSTGVCILSRHYKIFEHVVNNVNVYHYNDPAFHYALERKKPVVAWEFLSDYIVLISNVEKMIQIAERNDSLFGFLNNILDDMIYTSKGVFSSSFEGSLEFEGYYDDD